MFQRTPFALLTALLLSAPGLAQTARPSADDLFGTWTRRTDGYEITATFGRDGLRLSAAIPEGVTVTMDVDYVVTRDAILLGVLRPRDGDSLKEKMELEDRLFHCRLSLEEEELVVREVKDKHFIPEDLKKFVEGRYRRSEVKKTSPSARTGAAKTPPREGKNAPAGGQAGASSPPSWGSIIGAVVNRLLADVPVFNTYSSDPSRRIRELINESEPRGVINEPVGPYGVVDHPSRLTPERVHGGIQ